MPLSSQVKLKLLGQCITSMYALMHADKKSVHTQARVEGLFVSY